jgi:hypothetical protein
MTVDDAVEDSKGSNSSIEGHSSNAQSSGPDKASVNILEVSPPLIVL